ncbi:hypothetical protein ACQ4LE_007449 [Meloidogyne hapla]
MQESRLDIRRNSHSPPQIVDNDFDPQHRPSSAHSFPSLPNDSATDVRSLFGFRKQRSARLESGRSLTPHLRQNLRTSTFCQIFILNLLIQLLAGQTQAYAGQRGQSCRYSRPPRGKDVDGLHPST